MSISDSVPQHQLEQCVAMVSEKFGCSPESAARSIHRSPEHWKEELIAKSIQPCVLLNFASKHTLLAQELTRVSFIKGVFSAATEEEIAFMQQRLEKEVSEIDDDEEVCIYRHWKQLAAWWKSDRDMPICIIALSTLPDVILHDAEVYEAAFQEHIIKEGITHLVAVLTNDDNHVPFADYCMERLAGASPEEMRQKIQEEKALRESLLLPEVMNDVKKQKELLDKIWAPRQMAWLNFLGRDVFTSLFRRNKYLAQIRLRHAGLAHIRSVTATTFEEAVERMTAAKIAFPVVCKPTCGEANILVSLCDSEEMLQRQFVLVEQQFALKKQQTFQRCFKDRSFVIEEYIDGDEYVVNTFSLKGRTIVTDVWRSYKFPTSTFSSRLTLSDVEELKKIDAEPVSLNTTSLLYDSQVLENYPEESPVKDVAEYIVQVVQALGMFNGASHCEVRIDKRPHSDKYGKPVLIELNPRLQGSTPRSLPLVRYSQISMLLYATSLASIALHQFQTQHGAIQGTGKVYQPPPNMLETEPLTPECLAWPIVPRYYATHQSGTENFRKVLFLISPCNGVLSMRGLNSLQKLKTFQDFSRMTIRLNSKSLLRVSTTSDLFTCPGVVVMQGTKEALECDTAAIRAFEKVCWSEELISVLWSSIFHPETKEKMEEVHALLMSENVLYVDNRYISLVMVPMVFRSLLVEDSMTDPCEVGEH